MADDDPPVATQLSNSIREHDAYNVRVVDNRVVAIATAYPRTARRWISTIRHRYRDLLLGSGRQLVVGLGVQWTPVRGRTDPRWTPPPATLQLCVGRRCLVFHLAQVHPDDVPQALYNFLADPRVVFVGCGSSFDRRMLRDHYDLRVVHSRDLRALTGMGDGSVELMAERFLGYRGITRPVNVSMSAWHARRLSLEQVEYACVDAYLAFRLGFLLYPGDNQPVQRAPAPPPAPRAAVMAYAPRRAPVPELLRAAGPALGLPRAPPPAPRAPEMMAYAPRRAPVPELLPAPGPALLFRRAPPPAPRAPEMVYAPRRAPVPELHRAPGPAPRAPVRPYAPRPAPPAPVIVYASDDDDDTSSQVSDLEKAYLRSEATDDDE